MWATRSTATQSDGRPAASTAPPLDTPRPHWRAGDPCPQSDGGRPPRRPRDRDDSERASYFAILGIRTADQARELLPTLAKKIAARRKADGIKVKGSLKKSDMLPDIATILADPEAHFTPHLGEVVDSLSEDSIRAGREDPSLSEAQILQRRYAPLAELLGLQRGVKPHVAVGGVPALRYIDEADLDFVQRVAATAKSRGLAEPLYFKSERYSGLTDFGAFTKGSTKRAMATDQRYEGVNLAQGLQDTRPEQFLRGKARNIKRKHNWGMVADIIGANALPEYGRLGDSTVSGIREKLATNGVDFDSVALVNPGVLRALARQHEHTGLDERTMDGGEFESANIAAALGNSVVRMQDGRMVNGHGSPVDTDALMKSSGWQVVPTPVLRELEAQMVPSGKAGRGWDIAKGKASRAMLLAGNVPWLTFQVASNTAMGTAATGGRLLNPANWVGAARDWRAMSPAEKRRAGQILGLDATAADTRQVRLGATTNNDLVNAYRAFKLHPFWHTGVAAGRGPSLSQLNPLELMARADRGQNNVFRIVAGYSLVKRDAVRRMGESMGRADQAQSRLTSILALPAKDQLDAIRKDPDVMENHAEAIADWMGDYTTMTARERKAWNRAVMFMPYLRYSLRLLFYTLPVKHPAVTAVLAEMGQMRAEELRELLGEDSLPWNLGKLYFGKDGELASIDLKKANPAMNAVIDSASNRNLAQLVGVAPPWAGWIYGQFAQENNFSGKDWKVQGRPAPYGGPKLSPLDPLRLRILADDVLSIAYPYRLARELEVNQHGEDPKLAGTQGDDSLLFSPRPTYFKGNTPVGKLQKKFGNRRERFDENNESLLRELIPLLPSPDRSVAQARETKIIEKASAKPKGRKPKVYGAIGPSGRPFGAK